MSEATTKVKLGEKYRDSITGFEGTAVAKYIYVSGCVRIGLESGYTADGKLIEATFDDERLIHVPTEKRVKRESRKGGPETTPVRSSPER